MIKIVSSASRALAIVVAAAASVHAASCYESFKQSDYSRCAVLAPTVALHWQIDANSTFITFGVDADVASNSDSWFAVGLSDMGGMRGADIWWMRKDPTSGAFVLLDAYASDYATPAIDDHQDVELISPPPKSDSKMVYSFKRALVTCDADQDIDIVPDIVSKLVWATGKGASNPQQHSPSNRGNFRTHLIPSTASDAAEAAAADGPDTKQFVISMPNVTVPTNATSYLCTHFEVPADQKYHVIKVNGTAQSKLVHHMLIYGCSEPPRAPAKDGDLYDCKSMSATCSEFYFIWVPGSGEFFYPPEAGVAIGSGTNAKQYFSLQVHYNNVNGVSGVVDSSGMVLTYTPKLRSHDVGLLTLMQESISIPGNSSAPTVVAPNYCYPECTKRFPQDLVVISSLTHMHTLGLNQTVQHIRDGVELEPFSVRKHYDFSYQGAEAVIPVTGRTIKPGDAFILTCTYLPTQGLRNNITKFGENTSDEMCFNFIQYYPRLENIDYCSSGKETPTIDAGFCTTDLREKQVVESIVGPTTPGTRISQDQLAKIILNLTSSGDIALSPKALAFKPYAPSCTPLVRIGAAYNSTTISKSGSGSNSMSAVVSLVLATLLCILW